MKIFFLTLPLWFLLVGCSSKQYYEPEETSGRIEVKTIQTPDYISSINAKGATLDNSMFIDKVGIYKTPLPEGFTFINNTKKGIIAANKTKELRFLENNETIKFKSNVIAAAAKDNLIAIVFSNNSIGVYDRDIKQFKLKKYFKASPLNDTRISMPVFLDKIILFPTLDGKVIVVDKVSFKTLKTLTIDPQNEVKNIIILETINETMIAASPNKIVSIGDGNLYSKEFFIQSYIVDKEFIYIAALDGTIYKLDLKLNIVKKKKFKFAKFQALAIGESLYAVESQGFIVKLSKDFEKSTTYDFFFEEDEKVFASKNKIYIEDRLLILK